MTPETYIPQPHHHKPNKKIIIFATFLLITSILLYTAFYGNINLTGRAVEETNKNEISISASLTIPTLKLNEKFDKIEIIPNSNTILYAGDSKVDMKNSENTNIIIENFQGELSFNENNISNLQGKAGKVLINNVPISSQSEETIKLSIENNLKYKTIKIENIAINEISYITKGSINIDREKTIINIDNEEIKIKNFKGNLEIQDKIFNIQGYLNKLDIEGKSIISIG